MAAMCGALAVAFLAFACGNEAAVVHGKAQRELHHGQHAQDLSEVVRYELEQQRHEDSLKQIQANMTLDAAFGALKSQSAATPELLALVQDTLVATPSGRQNLRSNALQHRALQQQPKDEHAGGGGIVKAVEMLNEMVYEVQTKYELEHKSCCDYEAATRTGIEGVTEDIALFNGESAQARAGILSAQAQIQIAEDRLPVLKETLKDRTAECKERSDALNAELEIVLNDIEVITTILVMTDCKAQEKLALMSCEDPCANRTVATFGDAALGSKLASLKSAAAQRLVQRALSEALRPRHLRLSSKRWASMVQEEFGQEPETSTTQLAVDPSSTTSVAQELPTSTTQVTLPTSTTQAAEPFHAPSGPCTKPKATDKKSARCTVAGANCLKIQERFLFIQSGMTDKKFDLSTELAKLESGCEVAKANLENQIDQYENRLVDEQTKLARWTTVQNTADEQRRLKTKEKDSLEADFTTMTATCHHNYLGFENEECGLKKIRGELTKMKTPGAPAFFQDCEVSAWQPQECSVSCGGGTQMLMRSIVTHPDGGVQCLPLERLQPCKLRQCPIDCRLEDWQSWSGCTAECGGGIMQRGRVVDQKPRHGGMPCGEVSEARSCNMQDCDQDCELSEWTPWSECTKACGGGKRRRLKSVEEAARGTGKCPHIKSEERLQYEECNSEVCAEVLTCQSAVDVVLLLDSSAAIEEAGWEATKWLGQELVHAFRSGENSSSQVAALSYSGPVTWSGVSKCTGGASDAAVDLSADCQLTWASHFSTDEAALKGAIAGLAWPKGGRLTSVALGMAEAELMLGRSDAHAVVIVITAGRPLSYEKTAQMSKKVREKARLMFVAVTDHAPLEHIRHWSSDPDDQNIVVVDSFDHLRTQAVVSHIISAACPAVAAVGTTTSRGTLD